MKVKLIAMRVADVGEHHAANSSRERCSVCTFECWVSAVTRDASGPGYVVVCVHCAADAGVVIAKVALDLVPPGGKS